ncbi:hypothetical protein CBS101457_000084 [Exobasidium rhododendri]|nr:hypothetical protein CBS101457_000084 [Exobasidium rhododendri]
MPMDRGDLPPVRIGSNRPRRMGDIEAHTSRAVKRPVADTGSRTSRPRPRPDRQLLQAAENMSSDQWFRNDHQTGLDHTNAFQHQSNLGGNAAYLPNYSFVGQDQTSYFFGGQYGEASTGNVSGQFPASAHGDTQYNPSSGGNFYQFDHAQGLSGEASHSLPYAGYQNQYIDDNTGWQQQFLSNDPGHNNPYASSSHTNTYESNSDFGVPDIPPLLPEQHDLTHTFQDYQYHDPSETTTAYFNQSMQDMALMSIPRQEDSHSDGDDLTAYMQHQQQQQGPRAPQVTAIPADDQRRNTPSYQPDPFSDGEYTIQFSPTFRITDPDGNVYKSLSTLQKTIIVDRITQIRPYSSSATRKTLERYLTAQAACDMLSSDVDRIEQGVETIYSMYQGKKGYSDPLWMEGLKNADRRLVIKRVADVTIQPTDGLRERFLRLNLGPDVAAGILAGTDADIWQIVMARQIFATVDPRAGRWQKGCSRLQRTAVLERMVATGMKEDAARALLTKDRIPEGTGLALLRADDRTFRSMVKNIKSGKPPFR